MNTKKQDGFSIIELLIAIAVVGILVPTLGGFITTINRFNDRSRDLNIINSLVENKTESIRSMGFTPLSNGTTSFANELPDTIGNPKSATYTITSPRPNLRQVDINVTFSDYGKQKTLTYRTFVGEVGVGQY